MLWFLTEWEKSKLEDRFLVIFLLHMTPTKTLLWTVLLCSTCIYSIILCCMYFNSRLLSEASNCNDYSVWLVFGINSIK